MSNPTIESLETLSRELSARLIDIREMLEVIDVRHEMAKRTAHAVAPSADAAPAGQRERIATLAMAQIMAHPEVAAGYTDVMNDEITLADYAASLSFDAVTIADALVAALAK